MPRYLTLALVLLVSLCRVGATEDWPMWRGPRGDGTSNDEQLPLEWSGTENVAWKTELPYQGHSSPVVFDDTVYVAGVADPDNVPKVRDDTPRNRVLMAFDRSTGELRWRRTVLKAPLERIHELNSRASSTPAVDADRIYVSFLDEDQMCIAAFDHDGNELWTVRPGVFSSVHGYSSSPVLFEDLVIVNGDHDGPAYLVALDRATGKTVWKTERENHKRSYCTPIIRELGGRTQMLLSGSISVCSYDPQTGKRLWIVDGPTEQFVASLVVNDGLVFVTGGFPEKHILAIDPSGSGNVTDSHVKWHHERRGVSYVPSPVAAGDFFYVVSDGGIGSCFHAQTGELQWRKRMGRHYSGSLLTDGRRVYFTDDDGNTKVVRVGRDYEEVATNELGEAVYSSLAASNGQLFVRGVDHLWCLGAKK